MITGVLKKWQRKDCEVICLMNVLIRVDAAMQIGSGHIMRCLTLADELKANRSRVNFVCRSVPGHMGDKISERGYQVTMLPDLTEAYASGMGEFIQTGQLGVTWQQDADETIQAIGDKIFDWLIVDHYGIDYRWHSRLRPFSKKIMVIDDLANRKLDCDLLLDQTYGRDKKAYLPYVFTNTQVITGSHYALLRPQFSRLRHKALARRKSCRESKRILIFMGGTDLENVTGFVLDSLASMSFRESPVIDVVLGRESPHLSVIMTQSKKYPFEINVYCDVSNMAERMLIADLAVGAGGTTSWERCCLGLPTIVVQTADNQLKLIQYLDSAGVIVNLGIWSMLTVEKVKAGVEPFLDNSRSYQQMAEKSFTISDGFGVSRVVKKLIGASSGVMLHLACENDCGIIYKWQTTPALREYCRNPAIPTWSEHQEWFKEVLIDVDRELYLVCMRDESVGQVRLDKISEQDDAYEISILIAPDWQGKGIAKTVLDILRKIKPHTKFMAEVLDGNNTSQKLFEAAGYQQIDATWFVSFP